MTGLRISFVWSTCVRQKSRIPNSHVVESALCLSSSSSRAWVVSRVSSSSLYSSCSVLQKQDVMKANPGSVGNGQARVLVQQRILQHQIHLRKCRCFLTWPAGHVDFPVPPWCPSAVPTPLIQTRHWLTGQPLLCPGNTPHAVRTTVQEVTAQLITFLLDSLWFRRSSSRNRVRSSICVCSSPIRASLHENKTSESQSKWSANEVGACSASQSEFSAKYHGCSLENYVLNWNKNWLVYRLQAHLSGSGLGSSLLALLLGRLWKKWESVRSSAGGFGLWYHRNSKSSNVFWYNFYWPFHFGLRFKETSSFDHHGNARLVSADGVRWSGNHCHCWTLE